MSGFSWPPGDPGAVAAAREAAAAARAANGGKPISAAVLVPLFIEELAASPGPDGERTLTRPAGDGNSASDPHLVLTRRRSDLRRHAGEIAFPGGRMDGEDETLLHTALREAEEEIGLRRDQVSVIGELPPTSTFVTNYVIHPFVARIPAGVAWRLSPREVDEVLELPLSAIRASRTQTELERRGITFTTDAYVLDGNVIWGATARIIENLLERLAAPDAAGSFELLGA